MMTDTPVDFQGETITFTVLLVKYKPSKLIVILTKKRNFSLSK